MSGRLTFICVLEANLALSCVPSARRWPLRLFYPKVDRADRQPSSAKPVGVGVVIASVDSEGRTIWIVDAHRDDGKRFVVRRRRKVDCVFGTRKGYSPIRGGFDVVNHFVVCRVASNKQQASAFPPKNRVDSVSEVSQHRTALSCLGVSPKELHLTLFPQ